MQSTVNTLILILLWLFLPLVTNAQTTYPESEHPDNLPTGLSYQSGPGSNNADYNWMYPYGTKFTVKVNANRNLELVTTKYPNGELMFRQFDPANSVWSPWHKVLMAVNGKAGLGTSNPEGDLHISKNRASIYIDNLSTSNWSFLRFKGPGTNYWDIGQYSDNDFLEFRPKGSSEKRMLLFQDGVLKTSNKIDITASGDGQELIRFSTDRPWAFEQEGISSATSLVLKSIVGGKVFRIKDVNNFEAFHIGASSGNAYFAGNVGIGTTTPDSKLTVNGIIHSQEIKVTVDAGADYVFEPDYDLQSLAELNNYIKQYKHLPEVPSAAEMEEEGIELSKMNILLLKKIEEMTLHLIKQEERIEEQNDKLAEQDDLIHNQNDLLKDLLIRIKNLENSKN